jgi:dihydrofolate reductase
MQVTLDGYSRDPAGEAGWVDSWADGVGLLPPVDACVLGGGMFPDYEQFWTAILDDPEAAAGMLGRAVYPRETAWARRAPETPHLVVSRTLTRTTLPSARIVPDLDAVRALKAEPGGTIYAVGGPRLLTSLVDAGLLDELHLIVHPVVTGGGTAILGGLCQRQDLALVSHEPMPAGRLHLAYRVGAPTASTSG